MLEELELECSLFDGFVDGTTELLVDKIMGTNPKRARKQGKEYFAAASKRSRKKRKDQNLELKLRNFLLNEEQGVLREKLSSLKQELANCSNTDSSLVLHNSVAENENQLLKWELEKYRKMSSHLKNFLYGYNQFSATSAVFTCFNRNVNFALHRHMKFLHETTRVSPMLVKDSPSLMICNKGSQWSADDEIFRAFVLSKKPSFSAFLPTASVFDRKTYFEISRHNDMSYRFYMTKKQPPRMWIRIDVDDLSIPKEKLFKLWEEAEAEQWYSEAMKSIESEKEQNRILSSASMFAWDTFDQLTHIEYKSELNDSPSHSSQLEAISNISGDKKIYGLSAASSKMKANRNLFPSSTFCNKQNVEYDDLDIEVKTSTILPKNTSVLSEYVQRGLNMFRSFVIRKGSTSSKSSLTITYEFNFGSVNFTDLLRRLPKGASPEFLEEVKAMSDLEQFELVKFVASSTHVEQVIKKVELELQCCFFLHSLQQNKT